MATHGFIESRWTARSFVPALMKTMLLGVGFASCATSATAQLVIDGGEELVIDGELVTESSRLRVGGPGGAGTLRIINGGRLDVGEGGSLFDHGRIEIDGAGSVLELAGGLRGSGAGSSLSVKNGGLLQAERVDFPRDWTFEGVGSRGVLFDLDIFSDEFNNQLSQVSVTDGAEVHVERGDRVALPNAPGALVVSGDGSRFVTSGGMRIGVDQTQLESGSGRVDVLGGAETTVDWVDAESSELFIHGAGSRFIAASSGVGQKGGRTTVADGGRLEITGGLALARRPGDEALLLDVRGQGSELIVQGFLDTLGVDDSAIATIRVAEGASAHIAGSVGSTLNRVPNRFEVFGGRVDVGGDAVLVERFDEDPGDSVLHFRLSADDTLDRAQRALFTVGGELIIGTEGLIEVEFVQPSRLALGDVFDLGDF